MGTNLETAKINAKIWLKVYKDIKILKDLGGLQNKRLFIPRRRLLGDIKMGGTIMDNQRKEILLRVAGRMLKLSQAPPPLMQLSKEQSLRLLGEMKGLQKSMHFVIYELIGEIEFLENNIFGNN